MDAPKYHISVYIVYTRYSCAVRVNSVESGPNGPLYKLMSPSWHACMHACGPHTFHINCFRSSCLNQIMGKSHSVSLCKSKNI